MVLVAPIKKLQLLLPQIRFEREKTNILYHFLVCSWIREDTKRSNVSLNFVQNCVILLAPIKKLLVVSLQIQLERETTNIL